jgi:hypothetical protein
MLRTAPSLPLTGLLTLGFDPARFQAKPPACYRASWQLPGPDFHRQATTSLQTARNTMAYVSVSPPALLGARIAEAKRAAVGRHPCGGRHDPADDEAFRCRPSGDPRYLAVQAVFLASGGYAGIRARVK